MNEADAHEFEFHYQLTDSDFYDVAIAAAGKWKNVIVGTSLVAMVVGLVILVANLDSFWGTYLLLFGGIMIVLSTRPLATWFVRRQARGVLGTTADVAIDADGVSLTISGVSSKVPWTSLSKVRTNGRAVVLMREGVRYGWFTVRELDEGNRQSVLEYVKSHVGKFELVRDWFPFI